MKSRFLKLALAAIMTVTAFSGLVGCRKSKSRNNETDALVIASEEMDGVFNPFFATSGPDNKVMGYMLMGLLDGDENGDLVAGDEWASIAKDFTIDVTGTPVNNPNDDSNYYTTYQFLLKNGIKFSDGTPLTIKDVMFTFYTYLDPVYAGATTMYSTNIRGLTKYRTQDPNGDPDAFNEMMQRNGQARINALREYATNVTMTANPNTYSFWDDILVVKNLFREELDSTWVSAQASVGSYDDMGLVEDWQIFLYFVGYLTAEDGIIKDWKGWQPGGHSYENIAKDSETLISMVYNGMFEMSSADNYAAFKANLYEIITYWGTAGTALQAFIYDEISNYYNEREIRYKSISGITTRKTTEFNGQSLGEEHDVFQIIVNGVDPKAIYNFGVSISPRHIYSTAALCAAQDADPTENFGVAYAQYEEFMNQVVKAVRVPVGAGAYKATNRDRQENVTDPTQFRRDGVVYLMRNEHFMFPAKIKYINLQERNANITLDAIERNEIFYGEIAATADNINKVNRAKALSYDIADTKGYGYIGINASFVQDINVRRAIMMAMDTSLCIDYYSSSLVTLINRGMSTTNWAYPTGAERVYPFDGSANATAIRAELAKGGYVQAPNGRMQDANGNQLKYTFTIAGAGDHPMLNTFFRAQDILNSIGCDIEVRFDRQALQLLANGQLAVWAAAWGSTTDPDMYQVYHKYSNANSVKSWGYPHLLSNGTTEEIGIIDELSDIIEEARTRLSNDEQGKQWRRERYAVALDLVMELAIELPTYQRRDLYVFNKNIIDVGTLSSATPHRGPISEIWNVQYK